MHRTQAHDVLRCLEVEDAEVGYHLADLVEPGCRWTGRRGPCVAHTRDHVDLVHKGAGGVVGDPVTGRMVDGVPRSSPDTHQLSLGLGPVADGADDQVAASRPHHIEHFPVWHVRLDGELGGWGPERRSPDHQCGITVGEHQVGGEGELGQAGSESRGRPEGTGHHLTITPEYLRTCNDAELGPAHICRLVHRVTSCCPPTGSIRAVWYPASSTSR